jgi:dihydrofolate reductase
MGRYTLSMRKIIVYIATSADGYIARPDGGIDWLDRPEPKGGYGGVDFFNSIDTILWGRKTYDMAQGMGWMGQFGPNVRNYVFSHQPPAAPASGVEFVTSPIGDFARELRARPGKEIWMMGGAGLIGSFLDEGQIDEFSIHVIPVLIGEGIPLVQPRHRNVNLQLLSTKQFEDGVVHLNYQVAIH